MDLVRLIICHLWYKVTIFEQRKQLGGMLRYGIPNYRLPRTKLDEDINAILSTGIEVKKKYKCRNRYYS